MTERDKFDVFAQERAGPLWRGAYSELESAKAKAQKLAILEGIEFFVFSFKDINEVARFFPKSKSTLGGTDQALRGPFFL
jgi:hypothetical protein